MATMPSRMFPCEKCEKCSCIISKFNTPTVYSQAKGKTQLQWQNRRIMLQVLHTGRGFSSFMIQVWNLDDDLADLQATTPHQDRNFLLLLLLQHHLHAVMCSPMSMVIGQDGMLDSIECSLLTLPAVTPNPGLLGLLAISICKSPIEVTYVKLSKMEVPN